MNRLLNKVALITGGSSGIGLATAKEFIAQGASVIITGRSQDSLEEARAALGERAHALVWDTATSSEMSRLTTLVLERVAGLDIVFLNAGIAKFAPFEQMTPAIFDESMNTNVKGAYFTIQALLPLMSEGGSIILNTSINAHIGAPGASVYAATKAALLTLAKNLSAELLPRRIRVNAISPGPVETSLHSAAKLGISPQALQHMNQSIIEQIPLHRFGRPEEIAKVALFFASEDSSFVLGAELIVDGGMSTL